MDPSLQEMPSQSAKDTFFDVASIVAVVLIGLVVLVIAQPRFRTDVGTVWLHQGTQSHHVTQGTLAP
jgi:hypothetical protein